MDMGAALQAPATLVPTAAKLAAGDCHRQGQSQGLLAMKDPHLHALGGASRFHPCLPSFSHMQHTHY